MLKHCNTCNKEHHDLTSLKYVGHQKLGSRKTAEWFNCMCGSSLLLDVNLEFVDQELWIQTPQGSIPRIVSQPRIIKG